MKTKFTFLCCLAMVWCASLTAQTEFSKTGTRWYVPYWYYRWLGPHYSNSKTSCYYLGDDTLLAGQTWKKLYVNERLCGAFREQESKVWFTPLDEYLESEYAPRLLYDFSMQAGDKFYRTEYDEVGMFRNAEEAAALGLSLDGMEEMVVKYVDTIGGRRVLTITHDLVEGMGPVDSRKLFMWVPANQVAAMPKGREDNTHLNVYGGRVVAGLAMDAIAKEVPELAKYVRHYDFVVAQDGSGDFFTVQEAINAVPDFRKNIRTTILVRKGVYKEKIVIPESKINISLIGQDGAVLSYDDYAQKKNCFGEEKGTSGSSSCYIYAPDFYAENITFENSSGPVGQAVACFVSADRAYFKNCRFLGSQDTLYTYGKNCRQYYEDCYIEGTVDFIFGWSTAVFNRCHIHSKSGGYVTAPSTDQGQKYGYVFYDCRLTADDGVRDVSLSRPWRPYAQAVFIRCNLGKHISPAGWNNWGNKEAEKTAFYAEYESTGEGANPKARVPYSHQLKNLKGYEMETVLAGDDGWNPVKNGDELLSIKR